MKIAERIVMSLLVLVLVGGGAWIYFAVQQSQEEVKVAVARGDYNIPDKTEVPEIPPDDWRVIYPNSIKITIGGVEVYASVADTLSKRILGLSGTSFLPENVVKLFAFGAAGNHSIWMKDMNYPLDIIWVAENGVVVHIEENVSPESYPDSFSSPVLAWYVIEASAGFVESNSIIIGDEVVLPVKQ